MFVANSRNKPRNEMIEEVSPELTAAGPAKFTISPLGFENSRGAKCPNHKSLRK